MTTGQRMKHRRKEINKSAEDIAKALGNNLILVAGDKNSKMLFS